MLGQLYRIVNSSVTASRNFTHELMQVDAPRSSPSGEGLHGMWLIQVQQFGLTFMAI
jgi:hypothetical protein